MREYSRDSKQMVGKKTASEATQKTPASSIDSVRALLNQDTEITVLQKRISNMGANCKHQIILRPAYNYRNFDVFANQVASFSVTRMGAQSSMPIRAEIGEWMKTS